MKKVTAFVGSARKKLTYDSVRLLLDKLKSYGDVETEIVVLSDHRIEPCRGCKVCFEKGEASCPLKDDRDLLVEKMMQSDAVVFAAPSYSFQVSAFLKLFLDRLGFALHRPRFHGKTFTSVVAHGMFGANRLVEYLDFVGSCLGFNVVRGACVSAREPMMQSEKLKIDKTIAKLGGRFHDRMMKTPHPVPSFMMLSGFRIGRTMMKVELDENSYDYRYYRDKGWFDSDYFYPVRLGPLKKLTGRIVDAIAGNVSGKRMKQPVVS